jgi:hypothetical protein
MNEAGRCAAILWNLNGGLAGTTRANWYRLDLGLCLTGEPTLYTPAFWELAPLAPASNRHSHVFQTHHQEPCTRTDLTLA